MKLLPGKERERLQPKPELHVSPHSYKASFVIPTLQTRRRKLNEIKKFAHGQTARKCPNWELKFICE